MQQLKALVTAGCKSSFDEDTNRKIVVVNLFAFVGTMITLVLGLRALADDNIPLAVLLLIASGLFALSRQIQIWFNNPLGHLCSVYLLITCLMALVTLLIVTGGHDNTGPLWLYIVPPVAMFFAGFRGGLVAIAAFTIMICLFLFYPDDRLLLTHYTLAFKTRLLYSFLTVTFLSAFYEYSRQATFDTVNKLSERFERQATHDSLTRLPNRRGIEQAMAQELSRMKRNGRPLTLVLCDVDYFKSINDNYGHSAGDKVLSNIASLFKNRIREQDMVARWGGEEFLFVLPDTPEPNAVFLAEEIRKALEVTAINLSNAVLEVTASFGVCEMNNDVTLDRALTHADKALYKAKELGRNRVIAASALSD